MLFCALHGQPHPAGDRPSAAPTATDRSRQAGNQPTADPAAGRADAFLRFLYAKHSSNLYAHAERMLSDPHHAEDVVQETMLRAWRKSDTLSPEQGSIGGWLFKVAHNITVDRLRANRAPAPRG